MAYNGETPYTHNGKEVVAFLQDGEFQIPSGVDEVEVLIVAGGGGGGGSPHGGGAGAGGVIHRTNVDISGFSSPMTVNVGAGGNGYQGSYSSPWPSPNTNKGTNGEDSTFAGLTAIGGGGGGGYSGGAADDTDGQDGGSGGGGTDQSAPGTGLQPTSTDGGSGNDGGTSTNNDYSQGGGGAGEQGGTDSLGYGGDGLDFSTEFGTNYGESGWFGGGGGGAFYGNSESISNTGGQGGGGNSGSEMVSPYNPGDGMPNTGGGGGGAERSTNGDAKGGEGGSGIILIAYNPVSSTDFFDGTVDNLRGWQPLTSTERTDAENDATLTTLPDKTPATAEYVGWDYATETYSHADGKIKLTIGNATGILEARYRVQDSNNYLVAELDMDAGQVTLKKVVAGTKTTIASQAYTFTDGQEFWIKHINTSHEVIAWEPSGTSSRLIDETDSSITAAGTIEFVSASGTPTVSSFEIGAAD